MKKVSKTLIYNLKPVKIYLDDIEKIYALLADSFKKVSLQTDEYELQSIDELSKDSRETIPLLEFRVRDEDFNSLSLSIESKKVSLMVGNDSILFIGLAGKIKEILKKRERSLLVQLFYKQIFQRMVLGISGLLIFFLLIIKIVTKSDPLLLNVITFSSYMSFVWIWIAERGYPNIIILKKYVDAPSFWKRNSEKLFFEVIKAIVLLSIGYLFGKLTGTIP